MRAPGLKPKEPVKIMFLCGYNFGCKTQSNPSFPLTDELRKRGTGNRHQQHICRRQRPEALLDPDPETGNHDRKFSAGYKCETGPDPGSAVESTARGSPVASQDL